ncbi:MAG: hypothetical protein MPJ50_02370 [Pirellulales bacterium]|nr:hypothetical protein [Pirellulales bacterium]
MTRNFALGILSAVAIACVLGTANSAQAQGVRRPTVSPYLNLLRRDATPAENYYNLVRPEKTFRQSLQAQSRQIQQLQRQSTAAPRAQTATTPGVVAIPSTGHTTFYQTYSHYYFFPTIRSR